MADSNDTGRFQELASLAAAAGSSAGEQRTRQLVPALAREEAAPFADAARAERQAAELAKLDAQSEANVARELAAGMTNPQQFSDEEVPDADAGFVFRDLLGRILLLLNTLGELDALPSASLLARIYAQLPPAVIPADLSVTSILAGNDADDEMALRPVLQDLLRNILIGADAQGRIDLNPTRTMSRKVRRSPQDPLAVTARSPTDLDAAGYAAGHEWVAPSGVWVAHSVGEEAVWSRAAPLAPFAGDAMVGGALPLLGDAVPGLEPIFLTGLTRLRRDYDGPLARLRRESDGATLDVFNPDQVPPFARGTRFWVVGQYVQSGALRGTLAPADDGFPALSTDPQCGSRHATVFENAVIYNGSQTPRAAILIPAGITAQANNLAIITVGCFSHSGMDIPILELAGATPLALGHSSQSGVESVAAHYGGWRSLGRYQPSLAGQVVALSSQPDGLTLYGADRRTVTSAALPAAPLAGGTVGRSTRFLAGDGVTLRQGGWLGGAVAIYDRGLSPAEVAACRQSAIAQFDLRPQVRGVLDVLGDSITAGAGAPYFESTPRLVARQLQRPINVRNHAISGATIATQAATFANEVLPSLTGEEGLRLLALLGLGTNDLGAATPTPVATMISGTQGICEAAFAAGYSGIALGTIRPRGLFNSNPALEAMRQEFNAWIRAYAASDARFVLLDFDLVWSTSDAEDTRFYFDRTHQTDLGRARDAAFVAPRIDRFVASITNLAA